MIVIMENTHIKMRGKEREERNFGPHELCIFDLKLCVWTIQKLLWHSLRLLILHGFVTLIHIM